LDANVNILVISALSDKATGIRAIELGARGFIYKPFSDETLNEALTEIIEN
jgi:two-component system chemotaxis response regulator CheY